MKRLILLLAILLNSTICLAYDLEGDTNRDGVLSGSEQYLLENPNIEGATSERVFRAIQKDKQRQEKIALWEEQDAMRVRQVQREAAYRRSIIAQEDAYRRSVITEAYRKYVDYK
jgi:hypothetical protein